ncbi:MlaC/ttg2D family ABC transporter substrate-binding protein [Porticoccus sp.]|uniref:MlaC/ttg2D family ABC transporter substrate-binding protein n=1 Tax=Porticoccus sp. TaxID=2024853 RepID=UPI003F69692B
MYKRLIKTLLPALIVLVSGHAIATQAADDAVTPPEQSPHELIETVTDELLQAIAEHRETFDDKPQAFFDSLDCLLTRVIDFNWIASNVMGTYRAEATDEQREDFVKAFHRDLIETYGRGLISYGDETIVVLPPKDDLEGKRRVTVVQEIRGSDGVFPLYYSMALNREGEWKITNVVINGINLGKTFRNQFAQRAQKYDGNIDQVIDNWSTQVKVIEDEV